MLNLIVNPAPGHARNGFDLFDTEKRSELLSHVHFLRNKAGCSALLAGPVRTIGDCSGSLAKDCARAKKQAKEESLSPKPFNYKELFGQQRAVG
ncbi:MAG: hypothetical protein V5B30_16040 [Candidatus Accumulibacter delftensis]